MTIDDPLRLIPERSFFLDVMNGNRYHHTEKGL